MATFWVDDTRPDDTGDGLSLATAKKTPAAGLALLATKGDILNIVNSATYAWPTSETSLTAMSGTPTNFTSDFGYKIRGTTSTGTPALVTFAASGGDMIRRFVQVRNPCKYVIGELLRFDASGKTLDGSIYSAFRQQDTGAGPLLLSECDLIGAGTGAFPAGNRTLFDQAGTVTTGIELIQCKECYIQNALLPINSGAPIKSHTFQNCVCIYDSAGRVSAFMPCGALGGSSPTAVKTFKYNTLYESVGANSIVRAFDLQPGTGLDAGTVDNHSNLVFYETTLGGSPILPFMGGTVTATSVTHAGTIGFNVLQGGPNVSASDLTSSGWYQLPWDPNDDDAVDPDTYPTDQVNYGVTETTLFNAPGSTFNWVRTSGVATTILKDLRPRLYQTAGQGGTVPGALPAASTDYSVSVGTSNTAPAANATITLTVTALNTGTAATDVVYTAALPSGLTYASHVAGAGTYVPGTGAWTIGSLATSSPQTLTITVTVTAPANSTRTFTASWTSGNPATDTNSSNNSASIVISVEADSDIDPGEVPYLDVRPIFAPVLLLEINALMRTKRNRITQHEQRRDVENRQWREYTSRRVTIAPSTTVQIISSIERADHMALEATGDLQVSASEGTTDIYFPAGSKLALLNGDFTTLKLKNPSSTVSVDALLVVID